MTRANHQPAKAKKTSNHAVSRVGIIDTESGEVLDGGTMIYVPSKLRIKGFFMADQKGFEELAKSGLTGEAFKVLMLLMARMDFENLIILSQKEIGETLQMKKQNVSRAVKLLRAKGFFELESNHVIHIATELGWKGKVQNRHARQTALFNEIKNRHSAPTSRMGTENPTTEDIVLQVI